MAAVREIEGLIDEREIRDDVADDGVLEHRPVLPRGIMRMTAPNRSRRARFERDEHRPAPALDQSHAHARRRRASAPEQDAVPAGSASSMRCIETTRFLQLIEAHGDARRDISRRCRTLFTGASCAYGSQGRSQRRSNAWPLARPARPGEPQTCGRARVPPRRRR